MLINIYYKNYINYIDEFLYEYLNKGIYSNKNIINNFLTSY